MANRSNEAFAGALQLHKRFIFSSDNAPCFTACFVRRSIFSSARPRVSYITETCYQHNDLNASHFQRLEVSKPLARSATSCLQRKPRAPSSVGLGKRRSICEANIDLFTSRKDSRRAAGMNTNYSLYLINVIKSFLVEPHVLRAFLHEEGS